MFIKRLLIPFALLASIDCLARPVPGRWEAESPDKFKDRSSQHYGNCGSGALDAAKVDDKKGGGECYVGWVQKNEWLEFNFTLEEEKTLTFLARVASDKNTRKFHFKLDGNKIGNSKKAPGLGWSEYEDRKVAGIKVSKGEHKLRVFFETNNVNINYIEVMEGVGGQQALYHATKFDDIIIESEMTPESNTGNVCDGANGSQYGIDFGKTSDGRCYMRANTWEGLSFNVGDFVSGHNGGLFDITVRSASDDPNKRIMLRAEIEDLLVIKTPGKGSEVFEDYTLTGVNLFDGVSYVEALAMDDGINLEHITVTKNERYAATSQTIKMPGSICRYSYSTDTVDPSLSFAQYKLGGAVLRNSSIICPIVLGGLDNYGAIRKYGAKVNSIKMHIDPDYEFDDVQFQCILKANIGNYGNSTVTFESGDNNNQIVFNDPFEGRAISYFDNNSENNSYGNIVCLGYSSSPDITLRRVDIDIEHQLGQ